ncbi:MAG: VWA domain-containing protein [Deltaproteobacteria bacterium]|nr:VWA domain-containing protein [Deltaproteobacteria bacterium]
MRFDDYLLLGLLFLLPLYFRFGWMKPALSYPTVRVVKRVRPSLRMRLKNFPKLLNILALVLIILALARPQLVNREKEVSTKGTDIVLALDISGSMQAEDFKPNNRLYVAKEVLKSFVQGRQSDRIGLVSFAGQAYTQSPLTIDYGILYSLVDDLEIGRYQDGTAIGMAIAEGTKRLKNSEAETKIIILLTDGVNNSGNIDPATAARVAAALSVKVYTVGVGIEGGAPIPVDDPVFGKVYARDRSGNIVRTEMDEETLKAVAKITNAKYFRATDRDSLIRIYGEIDKLEKTDIKIKEYFSYVELYLYFLGAALFLFLFSLLLRSTWLWSFP